MTSPAGARGFRQSQARLHGWVGLLAGWVIFAVFVTGSIAFYREGLNRWMRPETAQVTDRMRVVAGAQRYLARTAPDAASWSFFVPDRDAPGAFVTARPRHGAAGPKRGSEPVLIGAQGRPVAARATYGGEFFYRFHYGLYYLPGLWARWLVGIAAMLMLVAILTGLVTHRRIFRDFFTLRRHAGQRSWLDGHNAAAVLALPFHLMISYTGLVTLMVMLLPWVTSAVYSDGGKFYEALYPAAMPAERLDRPMPLVDLVPLLRDAERRLGGPVGFVEVTHPNDAAARVTLYLASRAQLSARTPRLTYGGTDGRMLWRSPAPGPVSVTTGAMIGIHAGRFADAWLRLLYFLSGVGGSVMVASGLVLWTVKRREKLAGALPVPTGLMLVERMNVAVFAGLPLGMAGMLWANRLLPVAMAGRAEWEVHGLFLMWGAAALLALLRRPAVSWVALTGLTGVSLVGLPIYNVFATGNGIFAAMARGDWTIVGIDLALLLAGLGFGGIACRVARQRPTDKRVRRRKAAIAASAMAPTA